MHVLDPNIFLILCHNYLQHVRGEQLIFRIFQTSNEQTKVTSRAHFQPHAQLFTYFPGLFFLLRCIERIKVVDLRTVTYNVPPQEVSSCMEMICAKSLTSSVNDPLNCSHEESMVFLNFGVVLFPYLSLDVPLKDHCTISEINGCTYLYCGLKGSKYAKSIDGSINQSSINK